MSRKRNRNQHKAMPSAQRRRRLKAATIIAILILSSVAVLAERGSLGALSPLRNGKGGKRAGDHTAKLPATPPRPAQVAPQSASQPSKEYIYVGGRLIATQESGTPSGSPTPPTNQPLTLTAFVTSSSVVLNWTYTGSGETNFLVQREQQGATSYTTIDTTTPPVMTSTDSTLTAGVTYSYQVVASNPGGAVPPSNIVTVTLPTGAPAAPSGLSAQVLPGPPPSIVLSWQRNSNNEEGFKLERASSGGPFVQIAVLCAGSTSYVDSAVTAPGGYTYQVKAYNSVGDSAYSTMDLVLLPPPPPALSLGTVGITTVQLNWTDSAPGLLFNVFRDGSTQVATKLSATTFTDQGLTPNTPYTYQVQAFSQALGSTSLSNPVNVTTMAGCEVTTFSGSGRAGYLEGLTTAAKWNSPFGCAAGIDPASNLHVLFVADTDNNRIREIYLEGPNVGLSALVAGSGIAGYTAGNGDPLKAKYNQPYGVGLINNSSGVVTTILIADTGNDEIRNLIWSGSGWVPGHVAGQAQTPGRVDGGPTVNEFNGPRGVAYDPVNGFIYVADSDNNLIRQLDTTLTSSRVIKGSAGIVYPTGLTIDPSGNLYIADREAATVWRGNPSAGTVTALGPSGSFSKPYKLTWTTTQAGEVLYVVDKALNVVKEIVISTGAVSTFAGTATAGYADGPCTSTAQFTTPTDVGVGPSGELYVVDGGNNRIRRAQ